MTEQVELMPVNKEDPTRTLSDSDVKAIVEELIKEMMSQFYADLGRGIWHAVRALVIAVLIVVATLGAKKEGFIS